VRAVDVVGTAAVVRTAAVLISSSQRSHESAGARSLAGRSQRHWLTRMVQTDSRDDCWRAPMRRGSARCGPASLSRTSGCVPGGTRPSVPRAWPRRLTMNSKKETAFPTRGVPGGWHNAWDGPDDHAQLRALAEAAEHRQTMRAALLGAVWRDEIEEERARKRRGKLGCNRGAPGSRPVEGKNRHRSRRARSIAKHEKAGEGPRSLGPSPTRGSPQRRRRSADYEQTSPTPGGFDALVAEVNALSQVAPNFSEDQLRSIMVPFLILDGAEEEAIKPEHTRRLAELIPGAELILMPGTGHFAPIQQPEEFNRIVLDYLASPDEVATPAP
jgi:pimeloyl-ACP methyl ester carboxylesterase